MNAGLSQYALYYDTPLVNTGNYYEIKPILQVEKGKGILHQITGEGKGYPNVDPRPDVPQWQEINLLQIILNIRSHGLIIMNKEEKLALRCLSANAI